MNLSTNTVLLICTISGFMIVWLVSPWRGRAALAEGEPPGWRRLSPEIPTVVIAVPIILLILAYGSLPYAYYQALRIIVSGALAWTALAFWKAQRLVSAVGLGLFALAYNPIAPVHLSRASWHWVNALTIVVLVAALGSARAQEARFQK